MKNNKNFIKILIKMQIIKMLILKFQYKLNKTQLIKSITPKFLTKLNKAKQITLII